MSDHDSDYEDDDDVPYLAPLTRAALEEHLAEKTARDNDLQFLDESIDFLENWLSQFWYTDETAEAFAKEALRIAGDEGSIACVSCPTIFKKLVFMKPQTCTVKLFEYDDRFAIYQDDYVHYDYRKPIFVDPKFNQGFDVTLADPPFLSDECLTKMAAFVKTLSRGKIIMCTGAVMEDLVEELLSLHKCQFVPQHVSELANPFYCYANYNLDDFIDS